MQKPAKRRAPAPAPSPSLPVAACERPLASEIPFLLALGLAPLAAGQLPVGLQEPVSAQSLLLALLLCCLVWLSLLLRVAMPGMPPLPAPRAGCLLLALPAWGALTFFVSANRGSTILQVLLYATFAAAAWLAGDLVQRGGAMRLLGALLAGALVAGGLGLREYVDEWKRNNPSWRSFGGFTNPNFFAAFLLPALLLVFGLGLRQPEQFKGWTWMLVLGLLAATLGGAMAVTGSRGALLALGLGLAVFGVWVLVRPDFRERGAFLRLAVVGLCVAAAFAGFSGTLRARQAGEGARVAPLPVELCPHARTEGVGESNEFRKLTWQATLNMALKRPILGWGAGAYESAYPPHAIADFTRHAHNSYLQMFAEMGAPGSALWPTLLLAAGIGLLRSARGPEWGWVPGAGAALAATSAHNVVDSVVYVPAVGLLTWALIGTGLRPREAAAPDRARDDRRRKAQTALAAAGLALLGLHTLGRGFLQAGRAALREDAASAVPALETAQFLLPWEPLVAIALADAYQVTDPQGKAVEAARQATLLAPYRPPGYHRLAHLHWYQPDRFKALQTLNIGLEHGPHEIELLYTRARFLAEMGSPLEALADYRRIVEIEEGPVGQVRALGEVRDYRYARARMEVARAEEAAGNRDMALAHLKAAACLLAERRAYQTANPVAYIAVGERDRETQISLRLEEAQLWRRLEKEYRLRGENRLADLAGEQAEAALQSREQIEKVFEELNR